jgi:predicted alpha-1,2-mannosidase
VDRVDPRIGTAGDGQTFPATGVPFGMTQWTPQTRDGEAKCLAPYYGSDTRIQGFRASHFASGSCMQEYGSVTVMALTGDLKPGAAERSSGFHRESEHARPYRYDVILEDYQIAASLTATARAGFLRFQFLRGGTAWLLVQANARPGEGSIHIDASRREIYGANPVHRIYAGSGQPAGFSGYFVARFDRPFQAHGVWSGTDRHPGAADQAGGSGAPGAFLSWQTAPQETILVKIGTSFTSIEEARRNLDAEIPAWDFARTADEARRAWNDALSRIQAAGAPESRLRIFYTALYHAMLLPRIFSDAGGTYPEFAAAGRTAIAKGFTYYGDYSLWDTFRALHPLLTIIEPARTGDMVRSLVAMGTEGGWLPNFPQWNSYTTAMIGDHAAVMITDAYVKGIRGFDAEEAYRQMRKNATETPDYPLYVDGRGRRALPAYLRYGFIPLEEPVKEAFHRGEQVSRTLEYAYDDFAVSEMAKALGKDADYRLFRARSANYRNVIDPSTGFARGRHADGSWAEPFDPAGKYPYITEGLPFQYTFFVPQDFPGLIGLLGGREAFVAKLDALFAGKYYDHGNEPSHHIAYLYNYAGAPWKTQERVRQVMENEYRDDPAGLAGNDDCGQMSAWYVLSALGFYPVTPGTPEYAIGTPLFEEASVRLPNRKVFTIRAPGVSSGKFYIQSARLNGKPLTRAWIAHQQIAAGGELVFQMGAQPNRGQF